jgi:hypothetical protein
MALNELGRICKETIVAYFNSYRPRKQKSNLHNDEKKKIGKKIRLTI